MWVADVAGTLETYIETIGPNSELLVSEPGLPHGSYLVFGD